MGHPGTRWLRVSLNFSQNRQFSSAPFFIILTCYFVVKRLWSWAVITKLSVCPFRPALHSRGWVFPWSTSAFWLRIRYFPCKDVFSQFCLICLRTSVLTVFSLLTLPLLSPAWFVEVVVSFFLFWHVFSSCLNLYFCLLITYRVSFFFMSQN